MLCVPCPRFFFEISDSGDVYHDARGVMLLGVESAKDRALEIIRRLLAKPPGTERREVVCTVRDVNGLQLMQIRVEFGLPEGVAGAAGDS